MKQEEFEQIEEDLALHWKNNFASPDFEVAFNNWEYPIQPSIRANAIAHGWSTKRYRDALIRGWGALRSLFDSLHPPAWPEDDSKRAKFFWHHQNVDMKKAGNDKRGFEIDRGALTQAAASYLTSQDSQTNYMDWLFLDVLVFAEIEGVATAFKENSTMTPLGSQVAEGIADGNTFKYAVWRMVFFAMGIFFNFVAMPMGAYLLAQNGHEKSALGLFGLWVLLLIWGIATFPLRWRARRKFWKAFKSMQMVYYLLGENTISPRKLKEAIDAATTLGCHFDCSVFTIVDRIMARDSTAFIPSKSE